MFICGESMRHCVHGFKFLFMYLSNNPRSHIFQGNFNCTSVTIMSIFFSVTTPVGIAVGMAIASSYDESSQTALIVQGVLNAASAGILIYMSLVDFLAADFMHPKMQSNTGLQIMAHISLLVGAGIMSLLAKWA